MFKQYRSQIVILVCAILTLPVFAQTSQTTGEIRGTVSVGGDVLPGVTVSTTNQNTGLHRVSYTGADGSYRFTLLPPGTYMVNAELAGLGETTERNIVVRLGTSTNVPLSLDPSFEEEIVVTADAPVVDSSEPGLTYSVSQEQIEELPILGRDFKDLVLLTPGVSETFGDRVSLNGGRGISTDYNIDGAEANSDFFGEERGGTEAPFVFSQAAIKEFQVIRSTYSAEYNRGAGGTVNAVTKSGTNSIEGQLFYYLRDAEWADERETTIDGNRVVDFFDARNVDQYGMALGGPLVTDVLHYFVNADFQDINETIVANDFRTSSAFLDLDADTRNAFINKLNGLITGGVDSQFVYPSDDDQETYLIKLDSNLGASNHLSLRHNFSDYNNFPSESPTSLSQQGNEFNTVNSTVFQAETVITDDLFNQLVIQRGLEERPILALEMNTPETTVDLGPFNFEFGRSEFLPNRTDEEKWQVKDNVSWLWGDHYVKSGFEYLNTDVLNFFPREQGGQYVFNSVDDFLANTPSRFDQGFGPTGGVTAFDYSAWGIFLQDSWSYNDRLTLDFGLRYDLQDIPTPESNAFPNYPFVDDFTNDDDNIAPRLGFAYDMSGVGRSVLRGGFGIYYTPIPSILYAAPLAELSGNYNRISLRCSRDECPTYPGILTGDQFAQFVRSASDLTTVSPDLQAMESRRMSLGYEQQVGSNYSVGIEGVYASLTNQQRLVNINAGTPDRFYGNLPVYSAGDSDSRYPEFRDIKQHVSDGEGDYTALTLNTRKMARRTDGFSWDNFGWLAHYTWSEAIDQDSNERSTSSGRSYDPFNPALSEGRADYNVENRAVISGTYSFPFGLQFAGIYRWNSGSPYTAELDGGLNGLFQVRVNTPVFVDGSGNIIDLTQANGSTPDQLSQFLADRNAVIQERNSYDQPDFSQFDLRLSYTLGPQLGWWPLGGVGVELIGEVFNALNEKNTRVSFGNQEYFDGRFSRSKNAWSFTRNEDFGKEDSFAGQPRQYQAAVRITF